MTAWSYHNYLHCLYMLIQKRISEMHALAYTKHQYVTVRIIYMMLQRRWPSTTKAISHLKHKTLSSFAELICHVEHQWKSSL